MLFRPENRDTRCIVNTELNVTSAIQDTNYEKKTSNQQTDVVEGIQFLSLAITIMFLVQNKVFQDILIYFDIYI